MISPIEKFNDKELESKGIQLYIKRDDLVNGPCQGNKFRKLKYHLAECKQQGLKRILTFGGAFSNHIFATAAAGYKLNIETIGIIRGEIDEENPTIQKIRSWGMHLHPISRKIYRRRKSILTLSTN